MTPIRCLVIFGMLTGVAATLQAETRPSGALPPALREVAIDQKLNNQIPLDLKFTDENGEEVTLGKYFKDKPVIITPVYYECPMLCNQTLNGLMKTMRVLQFEVGEKFEVVTVSFDPTESASLAAAKKANYVEQLGKEGARTGWHFLTGTQENIKPLMDALGFIYTFDDKLGEYAHAAGIMVLTPQGRVSRYFYGVEFSPKDLRLGLVEASEGKIGSPVDQLLLFCYKYDPLTGTYGAVVMRMVQLGGLVTVICLGTFMFVMFRRDLRKKRSAAPEAK
jgi:protein SCO1/2